MTKIIGNQQLDKDITRDVSIRYEDMSKKAKIRQNKTGETIVNEIRFKRAYFLLYVQIVYFSID